MIITIGGKKMNVNRIHINAKCADLCYAELKDEEGAVIAEHDGYVPDLMPEDGGDYVDIEIDLETGTILNWKRPNAKTIEKTNWVGRAINEEEN